LGHGGRGGRECGCAWVMTGPKTHHDIEAMNEAGRVLARRRLPEGVAGIGQLHELIGRFVPALRAILLRRCRSASRPTTARG
jgi:hypothetical protein